MSDKTVRLLVEVNKENRKIVYDATSEEITSALGYTPMDAALKGANEGVSELDENGKVVATQLPSFVDDVIEGYYTNDKFYKESTHVTEIDPESGKIYVDLSTEKTYRWSGTQYVIISDTIALGETSSTAYRGDRGKIAYDHSQVAHAPSNAEKNQNAFSNIKVGTSNIASNSTSDTINITSGDNISITANASTKEVKISATDTKYENTTDTTAGLFSPEYKKKVDDVATTYLPLTGGKLSSNSFGTQLKIERQSVDAATIGFMNSNGVLGYVGMTGTANSGLKWWKADASQVVVLDETNYKTYVTPANIGAAASNHNHDSAYASKTHTHNYAGSSSAGGSATSAVALTSKSIGSNVVPVYFDADGKPVVCKYTLGDASTKTIKTSTAVSSAAWVNLATGQKYIPDMAFISYWNGAVNDQGGSNLKYCNKGAFGTAATKGVDTTVTSESTNLVTSGGVATALSNKVSTTSNTIVPTWWCGSNTANTSGYYHFLTVTMSQHEDFNITLLITNEYGYRHVGIFNTHIRCDSGTTTNAPDHMEWLVRRGWKANDIVAVVSGLTVKYYINQVVPQWSGICFKALSVSSRQGNATKYTTVNSTAPTTGLTTSATSSDDSTVSHASNADDATKWSGWTADFSTNNTADTYLLVATSNNKIQHRLSTSFAASSHSHSAATTSAAGYMSAADKTKLNGIATGANNYSLPTASSTLGGVKTTSTVTSTSGLTACPIISGVPYYKDTNTVYTHPTTSGNKHIPSGGSSGQILRWSADGTATWGADNNTTYTDFVKSGSTAAHGLVPKPPTTAGTTKYLREDGTWVVPPNTNTDVNVTQTNTTTNSNYRLLFSNSANDTNQTSTTRKSTNFLANPSTGVLTSKYLKTSQGGKLISQSNLSNATSANVTVTDLFNYKEVAVEITTMQSSNIMYVRGVIPLQYIENGNQFNLRIEGENELTDFVAVSKSSTANTITFNLRFNGTFSSYKMSTILLISI